MKGYWDEPEKTAETIDQNGWLRTGDIGDFEISGYYTFGIGFRLIVNTELVDNHVVNSARIYKLYLKISIPRYQK